MLFRRFILFVDYALFMLMLEGDSNLVESAEENIVFLFFQINFWKVKMVFFSY